MTAIALLSGCAGIVWEDTKWQGPVIDGNRSAAVVQSCSAMPQGLSDVGYCRRAFVDHMGRKVDVSRDVQGVLNAHVINVKEIAPWVAVPQTYGSPRAARNERLPYRLHILTISPLVVLAVPRDQTDSDYCSGNIFVQGCLPSEKFILEPYWWLRTPKVRPNSFWFTPEMPSTVQYLPNDKQKHTIDLKDSTLVLIAKDGNWEVARNAR